MRGDMRISSLSPTITGVALLNTVTLANNNEVSGFVLNNAGNRDFGLVGCRRSVPHLQRMLAHLESSLKDLEVAVGV